MTGVAIGPGAYPAPPPTSRHPGWPAALGPVALDLGQVRLRRLRRSDGEQWREIRIRDEQLISPWEASSPLAWPDRHNRAMWSAHRAYLARAARQGEILPFAITLDGVFAGQVTLGGIQGSPLRSGWVGYWVDSAKTGHRLATAAVALAVGHAFGPVGLHRVEATIAPENHASIGVVSRLGFRHEGYLVRYLDVGGAWRDHLLFAMTAEESGGPAGLLARVAQDRSAPR